jgi:hypothetical protein
MIVCFYNDYDWSAEYVENTESESGEVTHCDECGVTIGESEWRRHVYMREYKQCQECEYLEDVNCEQHNYGETFTYDCCRGCDNILKAIKQVEQEEGCPSDAQQPAFTALYDELTQHESANLYARRALEMFPDLVNHKFITRFAKSSN